MKRRAEWKNIEIQFSRSLGAILLAGSLLLSGCASGEGASENVPELLVPVGAARDTASVVREDCCEVAVYKGQVVSGSQEVPYPQDGVVLEILVQIGETVEEGQTILRLDESNLKKSIDALETKLSQSRQANTLENTIASLQEQQVEEEIRLLKEQENTEAVQQKSMEFESLRLRNKQAKENRALELENIEKQLAEMKSTYGVGEIKAPCSGTLLYYDSSARIGTYVKKDMVAAYVSDETKVSVLCPGLSLDDAAKSVNIIADDGTKTYTLTNDPYDTETLVSMALSGVKMYPRLVGKNLPACGSYVLVKVIEKISENTLTIPVNALFRDDTGYYVYCVHEDTGNQERRSVNVGVISRTTVEILEGLEEGEIVYVAN